MDIGGSQLNAVQIAGAVRDLGHEVIVLSEPGPMVDRVRKLGLEHVEIPIERSWPSAKISRQLASLVRKRRIDIVHGYEWGPVVEAMFGPGLLRGTPVVGTIMSMAVVWFYPRTIPLIVGTEEMRAAAVSSGYRRVVLLEPPVDTDEDDPALIGGQPFRSQHGIANDEILVVVVSRLAEALKLEGLLTACDAVGALARSHRIRLVIVGDGPMREKIAAQAECANALAGRQVVTLAGEMPDPRPAYSAADIMLGMGGSALRGLAFGKPLIVLGEKGFSELLTCETTPRFLQQGWFGAGPGTLGSGPEGLRAALTKLVLSPALRQELSRRSRQLVLERFSLHRAARLQEAEYRAALENGTPAGARIWDFIETGTCLAARIVKRRYVILTKGKPALFAREPGTHTS
jgi:glycosyltransferase involved in cell wall biosynthesis